MPVEVERKFVCDPHILEKLNATGAVYLGQYGFKDQYFDSADFKLTLKDFWLRKREGSWELKRPTCSNLNTPHGYSKYTELTDVPQIKVELMAIMGICPEQTSDFLHAEEVHDEFEKWLQDMRLDCFAEFKTVRCSYVLEHEMDDRRVRVDLDQADFGHCIGEMEVLVSEGVETTFAIQSIQDMAQKLGLRGEQKPQGKMEVYLQRFRPDHYEALVKAHVL